MALNDIIVAKEGNGGVLAEIALAPADIGAATTASTVAAAKALADEFTGNAALIYTSEGGNGWTTLTDPASFRTALELSTNGNAAGLYDNTAGQVGAVVNDFSFRINGDGVSADLDTANLTASRAYGLPNASGTLALTESADNVFRVVGSADATKKVAFEVDGLTTTTTRTLTVPDASGTIALTSDIPSGGSKTYATFTATDNQPPAAAGTFATLDTRNSIAVLDFDPTTDESAVFVGIMPEAASLGSGLIVRLHWMATSATSDNVRWGVQFERSNTDLDSDSFDTAVEANGAANGTSGILTTTAITVTTIDGITAGDVFRLKVYRNADDATNDTMTGDAELVAVEVRSAA